MKNENALLNEKAEMLKTLGHPVRLSIVRSLIANSGANVSFIQNHMKLPQSTVSQHISKLKAVKIIEGTRSGLEITYKVVDSHVVRVVNALFE